MSSLLTNWFDTAAAAWIDWMAPMGWQVTALVCVLALVCWLLRGCSARLRYALWLLVPLRLALPPCLAFATGWSWWLLPPSTTSVPTTKERTFVATEAITIPEPLMIAAADAPDIRRPDAAVAAASTLVDTARSTNDAAPSVVAAGQPQWYRWLMLAWGAIAGIQLGRLGFGIIAARRLVAAARPAGAHALRADVENWRRELGIRQPVDIRILPGSLVPMVVGVLRPCVILPDEIERRLEADELKAVLLHELQHVARHDALVNLAQAVIAVLYFFHPAVWWANLQLRRLREDACDEATVSTLCGRRRAYGSGMVKIAELLVGPPPRLALGVAESGLQVKRRLERILDPRLPVGVRLRWPERLFLLLAAVVLLPAAAQPARATGEISMGQRFVPQQTGELIDGTELQSGVTSATEARLAKDDRAVADQVKSGDVASKAKDKLMTISGRVVGPEGTPVDGAEITIWWQFGYTGFYKQWRPAVIKWQKPRFGAKSGGDGRFRFTFAESDIDENPMSIFGWPGRHALVVAAAKGYGPAWASLESLEKAEFRFELAKDDVPIHGRVLDLQGRPVAGASVGVERVTIGANEHGSLWQTTWAGLSENVRTDAGGTFTLLGVGRGRTALLHIDGPTIEHKIVTATTPSVDDAASVEADQMIEVVAGPTKPFEGVIRAKGTGQPLAGVVVCGEEERYHRQVRATTDAQGRYRLIGLPKNSEYSFSVNPPRESGYLPTIGKVADNEGLKPIALDFELRRGVQVRCRFIDKVTRQPVWGGDLRYTPLTSNPYYGDLDEGGAIPSREFRNVFYAPDSDGFYHLVAWPGLGIVGIMPQATQGKYLPMPLSSADKEKVKGDPQLSVWEFMLGCRLIEPRETDTLLDLQIELDPVPPADSEKKP